MIHLSTYSYYFTASEVSIEDVTYTIDDDIVTVNITAGRKGDITEDLPVKVTVIPYRLNDSPDEVPSPIVQELLLEEGM